MHGASGPQLHRQQPVRWLYPHSLGSSWPNTLMELPWVLRRAPPSGMVVVGGAAGTLGQCHSEPWRQLRESGVLSRA